MHGLQNDLGEGAVAEWDLPPCQLHEHHPKGPDVCRLVVPVHLSCLQASLHAHAYAEA